MRVREAISRLGFRPNLVGQSLHEGRTRTIGVVLPTVAIGQFDGPRPFFEGGTLID